MSKESDSPHRSLRDEGILELPGACGKVSTSCLWVEDFFLGDEYIVKPKVVTYICDPSILEAEAGGSLS